MRVYIFNIHFIKRVFFQLGSSQFVFYFLFEFIVVVLLNINLRLFKSAYFSVKFFLHTIEYKFNSILYYIISRVFLTRT